MSAPRRITVAQAAEQLGVSPRTVRRYISEGDLPAVRIQGRLLRVRADHVEKLARPVPHRHQIAASPGQPFARDRGPATNKGEYQ